MLTQLSCKLRETARCIENVLCCPTFYGAVVMCDSCELFEWCIEDALQIIRTLLSYIIDHVTHTNDLLSCIIDDLLSYIII